MADAVAPSRRYADGGTVAAGLVVVRAQINQREADLGPVGLAELGWRLPDDHLERRPHPPFEQMAAPRAAVGQAEHGMQMKLRLVRSECDVASQGQHLALLVDDKPA